MIRLDLIDGTIMLLPSVDRVFRTKEGRCYVVPDATVPELQFDITPECFDRLAYIPAEML